MTRSPSSPLLRANFSIIRKCTGESNSSAGCAVLRVRSGYAPVYVLAMRKFLRGLLREAKAPEKNWHVETFLLPRFQTPLLARR